MLFLLALYAHVFQVATLHVQTSILKQDRGCSKWTRSSRGLMSVPIFSSDAARRIGAVVEGPEMSNYWRVQPLGVDGTLGIFKQRGMRPALDALVSRMLGNNATVAHNLLEVMLHDTHEHTLGPFVNYMEAGEQYKLEHAKSWASMKKALQGNFYDKVFEALQSYLAPHPVRFHPDLNVSGWPFRKVEYDIIADHPDLRGLLYVGAPPHRDALWDSLNFDFCKCSPNLKGLYSHHTISYTLPLVLPEAPGGLRVWKEPLKELHMGQWLKEFTNCHPRCNDTLWDFHEYREGVLAIHSGQEFHAIGNDHIFETKPTERRLTLQGHGVFCDGTWYVF